MIVKCEQCETRFKIPDEKVTEKGVKVRCTKCQHTFRVKREGGEAVVSPVQKAPAQQARAAAPPADPFARFGVGTDDGLGEATRPGTYALGVEASRKPSGPLQPSFAAQMDNPASAFEEATKVVMVPPTTQQSSPFDFAAALGGDLPPAPQAFDFAAPAPEYEAPPQAYPPPAQAYEAPAAAYAPTSHPPAHDPFVAMDLGDHASPAGGANTQPAAPSVFGADGGDFFAGGEPPPPARVDSLSQSERGEVEADTSARASLFDMPAVQSSPAPDPFGAAAVAASEAAASPSMPAPPSLKPSGAAAGAAVAPMERFTPTGPKRRIGGLIFNLAIASVLVALLTVIVTSYLSEGKVELASFSVERLKGTFSSQADWATLDISNGLYDTRAGRPVFFVRGDVKNRTSKAVRAKVRAEILDGDTSIRHADAWIGTAPTPEDLYSISVADDVDKLIAGLQKSSAEVMPGEKRGFLVPFYEYPPDLKGFRVRVSVIEAGQGETAAR